MLAFKLFKLTEFLSKYGNYILIAILALVALFLFPNINSIAEKFGLETRASLKGQVEAHKIINQQTTEANKNLNAEISKEKESGVATTNTITDKIERDLKLSSDLSNIKQKRNDVIRKVINKPKTKIDKTTVDIQPKITLDTDNTYTQDEVQEVSNANITAIWETFERVERIQV